MNWMARGKLIESTDYTVTPREDGSLRNKYSEKERRTRWTTWWSDKHETHSLCNRKYIVADAVGVVASFLTKQNASGWWGEGDESIPYERYKIKTCFNLDTFLLTRILVLFWLFDLRDSQSDDEVSQVHCVMGMNDEEKKTIVEQIFKNFIMNFLLFPSLHLHLHAGPITCGLDLCRRRVAKMNKLLQTGNVLSTNQLMN